MSIVLDRPVEDFSSRLLVDVEPVIQPKSSPSLILKTSSWSRIDPPWLIVQASLQSCRGEVEGEFCILSQLASKSYVQTCFCPEVGVAWRLEWRITEASGSYTHYFASVPGDSKNTDVVLSIEPVVSAFKAFYMNRPPPEALVWQKYDI